MPTVSHGRPSLRRLLVATAATALCSCPAVAAAATAPTPSVPATSPQPSLSVPATSPLPSPTPSLRSSTVGGAQLASTGTVANVTPGLPAPPDVQAAGWLVADLGTGQVLAAHDAHGPYAPASTLKILTALTVIPLLDPTAQVQVTDADVAVDGSKVGIVPGHAYTVATLLQGMLMVSGNDAATALANAAGGTTATVAAMNAMAAALQAYDTHAHDVDGLDAPGQTSSAYDLALLSRAALALPAFRTDVGTDRVEFAGNGVKPFQIANHNPLLGAVPGVYGVKNGYTDAARASYVGAALRGGHDLVVVVMRTVPDFVPESEQLFDWGFAVDGKIAPVGALVGPARARTGNGTDAAAAASQASTAAAAAATVRSGHHWYGDATWLAVGVLGGLFLLFVGRREQVRRRRRVRLERRVRL